MTGEAERGDGAGALVRKLSSIGKLSAEEREAIGRVALTRRDLPARHTIVREDDRPSHCCLLLSGYAIRCKVAARGRRQILAFHIPGDVPDVQSLHLPILDHDLVTLTPTRVGFIAHDTLHDLHARFPRVAGMFWRETLIEAAILREWLVSLGQRSARARTAHFLCEIRTRLRAVGLVDGSEIRLPLTQVELADALGMSPVHMNRTLQELRGLDLIRLEGKTLEARDWEALERLGDFDASYLNLHPDIPATPP